jgi:hypothetical protein
MPDCMNRLRPLLNRLRRSAGCLLLAAVCGAGHAADEAGNVYMAGPEARIRTAVDGDLVAAAGRISVDQPVAGDAVLAAGSIEVRGAIGDDLRAAGGFVNLGGLVYGEALIAGGSIAFGPQAEVRGRTWLAGSDLAVAGRLHGGLKAYGKHIVVLGDIYGPVELTAESIEILGSARINGDVTYSSGKDIRIDPQARITGRVIRAADTFEFPRPRLDIPGLPPLRPLLLFGLLATGVALIALFPRFTVDSLRTVGASPLKSLGLGLAIFFSLPPVILLLAITIIGIPIALALAALYALALLVGYLVTAFYIGDRLLAAARRRDPGLGWRTASLAAALLLLVLARHLPYAGTLLVLAALLLGLGAMALQAFSSYSSRG